MSTATPARPRPEPARRARGPAARPGGGRARPGWGRRRRPPPPAPPAPLPPAPRGRRAPPAARRAAVTPPTGGPPPPPRPRPDRATPGRWPRRWRRGPPPGASTGDPRADGVGVEDRQRQRGAQPRQDPEPHDHRRLRPTEQLEVVVDGRHAEPPPVKQLERTDLDHDRDRLEHEQAADHGEEQLGVGEERERGQAGADAERAR